MQALRKQVQQDIFDTPTLLEALRDFASPRDKITALLRQQVIVRIRSGLYVFGPDYTRKPWSREQLANLIHGPSYISLDYALATHGLIPEGVDTVTSVCTGRAKSYDTPLGRFIYRPAPHSGFCIGVVRVPIDKDSAYLMASPSKAMADMLREHRGVALRTRHELLQYLTEDRRILASSLAALDPEEIEWTALMYQSRKIRLLAGLVRQLQIDMRTENQGDDHA